MERPEAIPSGLFLFARDQRYEIWCGQGVVVST